MYEILRMQIYENHTCSECEKSAACIEFMREKPYQIETVHVCEEITDLFDESRVCDICRDECVRSVFKAKRAIYYGKQAMQARRKAWKLVYDLYPELKEQSITYIFEKNLIEVNEK